MRLSGVARGELTPTSFAWSMVRIVRFNCLLRMGSKVAPPELQHIASELAGRLGLAKTPMITTTSAHLSPMVWWIGGRVRVVLPAALTEPLVCRLPSSKCSRYNDK